MGKRDAVERFRARFAGVPEAERAEDLPGTPDERLRASLALHGLAVWQDLERVMRERGDADPSAVVDEVNRRRLEASPMPVALRARWRARARL